MLITLMADSWGSTIVTVSTRHPTKGRISIDLALTEEESRVMSGLFARAEMKLKELTR
jgi:hypothetical protein